MTFHKISAVIVHLRPTMVRASHHRRWMSSTASTTIPQAKLKVHGLNKRLVLVRPAGLEDTGRLQPGSIFRHPQSGSAVLVLFKLKDAMFGARIELNNDGKTSDVSLQVGNLLEQQGEERMMMTVDGRVDSQAGIKRVFDDPPRDMARKPITRSWFLGIPVMDLMTPLGIGQSMMFFEPRSSKLFTTILERMPKINMFTPESVISSVPFSKQSEDDEDLEYMLASYLALTKAEMRRDDGNGQASVVVVKDMSPFRRIWERATRMLTPVNPTGEQKVAPLTFNSFLQRIDRSDLRHYYSSFIQRAARLKDSEGSLTMLLRAVDTEKPVITDAKNPGEVVFTLDEFEKEVKAGVRALEDFERLVILQLKLKDKLKLTAATLNKLQIPLPASAFAQSQTSTKSTDFVEEATKARFHGEELMSIVDGHIVAPEAFKDFLFDPRASLTRIGAGSGQNEVRDTRPELVRDVAGGLRIEISDLYESVHANPQKAKAKMDAWKKSLNCFQDNTDVERGWKQQAVLVWMTRKGWFNPIEAHPLAKFDSAEVDKLDLQADEASQGMQFKKSIKQ